MAMTMARAIVLAAVLLLAPSFGAIAAEPVRHIGIYVQPYYQAARTPGGRPQVAIGQSFSGLLASTRREDIVAARDKVMAEPNTVTPSNIMRRASRTRPTSNSAGNEAAHQRCRLMVKSRPGRSRI